MKQKHWWALGGFVAGTYFGHMILSKLGGVLR
jgi:hypothetical protein